MNANANRKKYYMEIRGKKIILTFHRINAMIFEDRQQLNYELIKIFHKMIEKISNFNLDIYRVLLTRNLIAI